MLSKATHTHTEYSADKDVAATGKASLIVDILKRIPHNLHTPPPLPLPPS